MHIGTADIASISYFLGNQILLIFDVWLIKGNQVEMELVYDRFFDDIIEIAYGSYREYIKSIEFRLYFLR